MNVRLTLAWLLIFAAGWGMNKLSVAQEGSGLPGGAQQSPQASPLNAPSLTGPGIRVGARGTTKAIPSIRQAAEAVRDAESQDAKADAQAKLTDYLAKYFDDDMVRREAELTQIEERLVKLRELLERRRNSKQEIINLQAKVALNEVSGLGFYNGDRADDLRAPGASNFDSELMPPTTDPGALRAF